MCACLHTHTHTHTYIYIYTDWFDQFIYIAFNIMLNAIKKVYIYIYIYIVSLWKMCISFDMLTRRITQVNKGNDFLKTRTRRLKSISLVNREIEKI